MEQRLGADCLHHRLNAACKTVYAERIAGTSFGRCKNGEVILGVLETVGASGSILALVDCIFGERIIQSVSIFQILGG